jgi:hypothetical protein
VGVMNNLLERRSVGNEITISVHFVSGDTFVQPLPIDQADAVQEFMDWFRNPGKHKVWAWHVVAEQAVHMLHHDKIIAVDIEGYIEPDGRSSRWYERLIDRIRLRRL